MCLKWFVVFVFSFKIHVACSLRYPEKRMSKTSQICRRPWQRWLESGFRSISLEVMWVNFLYSFSASLHLSFCLEKDDDDSVFRRYFPLAGVLHYKFYWKSMCWEKDKDKRGKDSVCPEMREHECRVQGFFVDFLLLHRRLSSKRRRREFSSQFVVCHVL